MSSLLVYVSATFLVLISLIHVYWAFGGRWGSRASLPQTKDGAAIFLPRKPETLAVAVLMLGVCTVLVAQSETLSFLQANSFTKWSCILCGSVFFLRAIGDFNYLGFFKRVKHTAFSYYDTRFYSPLCLFLAFSFLLTVV
ncbi:DUF3995 domain-containing protein [Paenibacillus sp. Soil750]|uniref:DUF3995 domain-containing protein n=1 Tax=Paenibacillus sp. Soil750 TaxID=1736398 RepID=UPI0006FD8BCC|nr:DUF3995 domain-containing protein [Paenibacillus sp. Soil750]KRE56753.1 hypothetical protein ASL11_33910 [Paenibacillus sp. Soil750]